jgi:hypothetical protein
MIYNRKKRLSEKGKGVKRRRKKEKKMGIEGHR